MLRTWLALIVAPSTALGVQTLLDSLVTPACATQSRLGLHASAALGLAVAAVLAVLAFSDWSLHRAEPGASPDDDGARRRTTRRFLAIVGAGVAALSALVILALWLGAWILSPCDPWP